MLVIGGGLCCWVWVCVGAGSGAAAELGVPCVDESDDKVNDGVERVSDRLKRSNSASSASSSIEVSGESGSGTVAGASVANARGVFLPRRARSGDRSGVGRWLVSARANLPPILGWLLALATFFLFFVAFCELVWVLESRPRHHNGWAERRLSWTLGKG